MSNVYLLAASGYKVLQTSELPLLLKKSEVLSCTGQKNVSNVLVIS